MYHHILVPLDGSNAAEVALEHAATLAQATGARITLAAVVPRFGWAHVPHISELDSLHRRLATEYLSGRAEELRATVARVDTAVLFGEIAETLSTLSEGEIGDVDLVVMSTHGIVEGEPSHAREILMASPAPVLMIRSKSAAQSRPGPQSLDRQHDHAAPPPLPESRPARTA